MKKLIVVALLALSFVGMAQEKKNRMHGDRPEFTPEQQSELQVKKLTLELDLTAKQQKEIAEIVSKQQVKRQAMRAKMQENRAENKKLTSDEKFVIKRDAMNEQIAHKNEIQKVLTPEQFEKWEKMHKDKREMGKKRMKKNFDRKK